MISIKELFLEAFQAFLENRTVEWEVELSDEEWDELFELAQIHHVLPLIFHVVYNSPSAKRSESECFQQIKKQVIRQVSGQTIRTQEFLDIYNHLQNVGIRPLVVKGIICRNIYPQPDYRISGDEDLLISPDLFLNCHQAMLDFGMEVSLQAGADEEAARHALESYEVPYGKRGSMIYIELHKSLFPPDSDAYGEFNQLFEGCQDRVIEIPVEGVKVATLGYTDHLFYLICHAFKHFLHSGFGLRQVSDMVIFANTYGSEIDWQEILEKCKQIHAELFTAALFKIGEKYLTFSPEQACYPVIWREIMVDEEALLDDLLCGGVYGGASMSRQHSSNITLNRVAAEKQGKKISNSLLQTIFPSLDAMKGRFLYLEKYPWLLPVAWIIRIWKYRKESSQMEDNSAGESIRIGNQRVELMKKYGIIKED